MDIKKFTKKDEEYFSVIDGKVVAVESLMYGDDDDIYDDKKDYRFLLNRYEGPLDLLLYLVRRNKIEIEDIFVSDITSQYLEIIKPLQTWDDTEIDYAGEFITMAAELIEYKSKRMLPTEQVQLENGELPGNTLIRRLQEYDMLKQMAEKLRADETINRFTREPVFSDDDYRLAINDFDLSKLLDAYARMIHRVAREEMIAEPKTITKERFSVSDRMNYISRRVFEEKSVSMFSLFDSDFNKLEVVNTFLATLELMKRQIVTAKQDEETQDIQITIREGVEAPLNVSEEEIDGQFAGNS